MFSATLPKANRVSVSPTPESSRDTPLPSIEGSLSPFAFSNRSPSLCSGEAPMFNFSGGTSSSTFSGETSSFTFSGGTSSFTFSGGTFSPDPEGGGARLFNNPFASFREAPRNDFTFPPPLPSTPMSPPPAAPQGERLRRSSRNRLSGSSRYPTYSPATNRISNGMTRLQLGENREKSPLSNLQDLAATIEIQGSSRDAQTPNVTLSVPTAPTRRSSAPAQVPTNKAQPTPHNVLKEAPPKDAFNDPNFQSNLKATKALAKDLASVLGSSELQSQAGSAIHGMHLEATKLANFQLPTKHVVSFVGDSGVGKSSLLNSLLHKKDFILARSGGHACTCVVTEFHYHDADSFRIDVDLFDKEELLDELNKLLLSYRRFHLQPMEDDQERQDLREQAKLADDTFHSMFRGPHLPDRDFLLHTVESEVRDKFRSLIAHMRPNLDSTTHSGLTEDACANLLRQLSSESSFTLEPAAWPYIRKIRVFLKAHILSKGLILVDLPGLRDSNYLRRNTAHHFLRTGCDEIFAVCNISRAATDQGVIDVMALAKEADLSNIGIVCTRSDQDLDGEETELRTREDREFVRLKAAIQISKQHYDELAAEFQRLMEASESELELGRTCRPLGRARENLGKDEFNLQAYLIRCRNELVSKALQQEHKDRAPNNLLQIFCVSNAIYKQNREKSDEIAEKYLDLSGIIHLRRYCISMVSNSQYRAAMQLMQGRVLGLLSRIKIWLLSGADVPDTERRHAMSRTMLTIENRLKYSLLGPLAPVHRVSRTLRLRFATEIYERQDVDAWSTAAQQEGSEWEKLHSATFRAFCQRDGRFNGENWNEKVIRRMADDLSGPWKSLGRAVALKQKEILKSILDETELANRSLEQKLENDLEKLVPLRQALQSQERQLERDTQRAFEQADKELKILHTDGLKSTQTSFIVLGLAQAYSACLRKWGNGCHRARVDIMDRALSDPSLFSDIMSKVQSRYHEIVDTLQSSLETATQSYLEQLRVSLNLVRNESTTVESQQDDAFNNRLNRVFSLAQDKMQSIQGQVSARQRSR